MIRILLAGLCLAGASLGAARANLSRPAGAHHRAVRRRRRIRRGRRAVAQRLSEKLGQPFVVENRTGAGGRLGATQVARAPADGYTLLLGSNSEIAQYPNVAANVPYDSQRDFAPIAMLASVPLALVVAENLPVKTVQELLAHARQKSRAN